MAQRFIRCQLCGMPHPAEDPVCPVHMKPVVVAARSATTRRSSFPPPPIAPSDLAPSRTRPLTPSPSAEPAAAVPSITAPLVGRLLQGRYRVTGMLAQGGMGVVYDAVQVNLGRRVAIKCLHQRYARDAVAIARFQHEAVVSGGFGHPHIVEVFDMGRLEDGAPFLVMERLDGETLTARLRRDRRLSLALAVSVARQTVSALVATHARSILHRDLKPDNLFLVERGEVLPRVKVLDYGVSKAMTSVGDPRLTRAGFVMGTPAYMAPEQWMGRRDIDHRADLFAVGVMLYEMLTGGFPYEGASQGELFLEIVRGSEAPPLPSSIAPGVPRAIDAVVLQALRRDRDERFQSAREFLEAIRAFGAERIAVSDEPPVQQVMDALSTSPRRAFRRTMITSVEGRPRVTGRQISVWAVLLSLVVLGLVVVAGARSTPPHSAARRPVPAATAPAPAPTVAAPAAPEVVPAAAPPEPVAVVQPPGTDPPSEEPPARHRHRRHGSRHGRHAVHTERAPRTPHAAPTPRAHSAGRRGSGGGAGSLHISREW